MLTPNSFIRYIKGRIFGNPFSSKEYWQNRYRQGGNSGGGSYSHLAEFKAEVLNQFVVENSVHSVIEFGCGDGNQLRLANYPSYIGYDVSADAINICQRIFNNDNAKEFALLENYNGGLADLSISLDVIFHLVEDDVYDKYMRRLFNSASRYVVIYSSNMDEMTNDKANHVKHRKFTQWVSVHCPKWKLTNMLPNKYPYDGDHTKTTFADFYFYSRG